MAIASVEWTSRFAQLIQKKKTIISLIKNGGNRGACIGSRFTQRFDIGSSRLAPVNFPRPTLLVTGLPKAGPLDQRLGVDQLFIVGVCCK
jgi:hypothetical protein